MPKTLQMPLVEDQQFHTILAALRYYQENGQGDPLNRSYAIHDIATNCGEVTSLDEEGINELCEYLNCDSRSVDPEDRWRGTCSVCGDPFSEKEWDDRHSDRDGEDCHAFCCPACRMEDDDD